MEITNKKSVYQHIYLISNFIKIIINHYENKIGYYKHIYFYIIHHENKYRDIIGTDIFFIILYQNNQKQSVTQSHYKLLKNTIVLDFG